MRRKTEKLSQTDQIIIGAALRCGYNKFSDIEKKCGFPHSTFSRYRDDIGRIPLSWVSRMDKEFGFTDEEIVELVRG